MKQQIEISIKDAFELIKYFNHSQNAVTAESIFEKITSSNEFSEFLRSELETSQDKIKKVKDCVKNILSIASGYPKSEISSNKNLKLELKVSPNIFDRLHRPFNKLLKSLNSNKVITSSEVAKCEKVKDCEDLILKKIEL